MRKGTEKRRVPRLIQWLDEGWLFSLTESVTVLIALVVGMALYWLLCQKLFWPLGSLFHTERGTLGEVLVLMSSMIISSIPLLFLMPFATVFKEEIAGWICGPPIKVWARRQWKATTGAPFAAEEVEKRLGEIARAVQASPPVGDDPQAGFWKAWHAARLMGTGPKRSSFGDYAREGR